MAHHNSRWLRLGFAGVGLAMCTLHHLIGDESGAVTIDWVALTSGLLLLGIAVVYTIFNSGVASVVGGINGAMEAVGIVNVGDAPDLSGTVVADAGPPPGGDPLPPDPVSNDLVLADGTMVPEGSKVVDSKVATINGQTLTIVVLETPGGGKTAISSTDTGSRPPPTDSLVTAGNTVTTGGGTTYDMSGYTAAPSSYNL